MSSPSRARCVKTCLKGASSRAARRSRSRWQSSCSIAGRRSARRGCAAKRFAKRFSRSGWSIASRSTRFSSLYLNLAAYGNQVVGAGRASRAYFGSDPSMLTPAQAAFLAGLPQRPTGYNPFRNRQQAIARQRTVLRRMLAAGALSPERATEARDERLEFTRQGDAIPRAAFRRDGSERSRHQPPGANRDHAGCGAAERRRRHHQQPSGVARSSWCVERRRRRARQRQRRVAGVGGIGRLRRRRARRRDQRSARIAAARIGAQALHVRARVRIGFHAGVRAGGCAVAFSDRRRRRPLQPAQLRRPLSRSVARAPRARRLGECSGSRPRLRARSAGACSDS